MSGILLLRHHQKKVEQLPSLLQYPSDQTKQFAYLNKPFNFQAETFVK